MTEQDGDDFIWMWMTGSERPPAVDTSVGMLPDGTVIHWQNGEIFCIETPLFDIYPHSTPPIVIKLDGKEPSL